MSLALKTVILILLAAVSCNSPAAENIAIVGLFKDKAIITIDGKRRVLKSGETSPEGVTLVSASSKEAVLEVDGLRKTYTLDTRIGAYFEGPPPGVTVTVAPDSYGMYHVNGSINGFQVDFVIDTGATLVSMNRNHAKRIGLNYKLDGIESASHTASGIAKIYLVQLDKVRVGDIELRDVAGAVHDDDFPAVVLLGNSFLNKINVRREGRILQLEKK